VKWTFKGKIAVPGLMKKPGYSLSTQFKKWMNFLLPELIGKSVVVIIEEKSTKPTKKSVRKKKVVKKRKPKDSK
jgi:hypothetical protein